MTGSATATAPIDQANPVPGADDVQQTQNETLDRFLTGTITVLPFVGLGVAAFVTAAYVWDIPLLPV